VTGVQFFGKPQPTKAALLAYQQNRGFLVSGFGGANKMLYDLGLKHWEPRAGQIRNGHACTEGLHFFIDARSAFEYGRNMWQQNLSFAGVVTLRLTKPRGLVYAIKDATEFELNINEHEEIAQGAKPFNKFPQLQRATGRTDMQHFLLDMVEKAKSDQRQLCNGKRHKGEKPATS
jgi:hypothetical protein